MEVKSQELMIAWAAGVIEGEGTIICEPVKNRASSTRTGIAVTMSDEDVVQKLFKTLGVGTFRGPYTYKNKKPLWTWAVQNQKGCFETLLKIMPYLGKRRLEKAHQMFKFLETKVDNWND